MAKLRKGCLIIKKDEGGSLRLNQDDFEYQDDFGEKYYYNMKNVTSIDIDSKNTMISASVIDICISNDIDILLGLRLIR